MNGSEVSEIQWASYQIRKKYGMRMRRECRERFPLHRPHRNLLVSDPGMQHGTCVPHVPWCLSGSLTSGGGKNVPGIPGACAARNFTHLARAPCDLTQMHLQHNCNVESNHRLLCFKLCIVHFVTSESFRDTRFSPVFNAIIFIIWSSCTINLLIHVFGVGVMWK